MCSARQQMAADRRLPVDQLVAGPPVYMREVIRLDYHHSGVCVPARCASGLVSCDAVVENVYDTHNQFLHRWSTGHTGDAH